ncbi:MAG: histone deacetylase [Phycisphaerales bacterium]|nr:MAG: histone deacetylase [Phycisphaerales bacterium]
MTHKVHLLFDERMIDHDPGPMHPERPMRLQAIVERLRGHRITGTQWSRPHPATREQIARIHDEAYIDHIDAQRGKSAHLDPDTATSPDSVNAAYLAAGAAVDAVTKVMKCAGDRAFALVRPPGHHAERDRAMGFCIFNNTAIAAAHAVQELGCRRVLIVDWDVHHPNGTQQAFYDRDDVFMFSSHRYPFYPGTGALDEIGTGAGEGLTVNVPLGPGQGDDVHWALLEGLLRPIAEQFQPELVLVSAGYDSHREDLLGGMRVTDDGFAAFSGLVSDVANRYAQGRLVMVLEGGYDLAALGRGVCSGVEVMAGATPPICDAPTGHGAELVKEIFAHHRRHWPRVGK